MNACFTLVAFDVICWTRTYSSEDVHFSLWMICVEREPSIKLLCMEHSISKQQTYSHVVFQWAPKF